MNSVTVMLMLFHYQFNCYDFNNYINLFVVLLSFKGKARTKKLFI